MATFGQTITAARRRAGLSQKDVAARIHKEDGTPISPQYLNDLEHDRRNPPAERMLAQFAGLLGLEADYLCFIAGQLPPDLRQSSYAPERVAVAFRAFRQSLAGDPKGAAKGDVK